jgi:hypothetical protein
MENIKMKADTITIENTKFGLDEMVDRFIAAKITGLAPRTIQNLASERKLPFYKAGRTVNGYLVRELLEWCESRKVACVA